MVYGKQMGIGTFGSLVLVHQLNLRLYQATHSEDREKLVKYASGARTWRLVVGA